MSNSAKQNSAYPRIIYLNGVSSSGKSTIASKLREITEEPTIFLSFDQFHESLNGRFADDECPLYDEIAKGVHLTALGWHQLGFNVVIDTVIEKQSLVKHAYDNLPASKTYYIAVVADLKILLKREKQRGRNYSKLVKEQYECVHKFFRYDLTIDTVIHSADENCSFIMKHVLDNSPIKHD